MGKQPEAGVGSNPPSAPSDGASERESIGAYLASQRKLRGISLDELAQSTRIPRRNLERLEAGVFDAQPDGFVRGFVRTVAAELGLDAQEAVMRLVGEPAAADEEWQRRRRLGTALVLATCAAAALLLGGLGLRSAARWVASPAQGLEEQLVYRHDAVRALLSEQRAERPSPAREATEAPEPAPGSQPGP